MEARQKAIEVGVVAEPTCERQEGVLTKSSRGDVP